MDLQGQNEGQMQSEDKDTFSTSELQKDVNPKIKHIVISGGHIWGLYAIGALRKAIDDKFIDMSHIESFYCTSVGSIIAVIVSLDINMDILFKYLIDRPWTDFFKQRLNSPVDVFDLKGVYGKGLLIDFFLPLFRAKDISIDITMGEFYQLTGKEIHFFTTEFNQFISVDMSYKTHPSWKLMDAAYCSVCVPFLLSPIICEGACYFDGGMTNNYPIEQCIVDHPGIDTDSIFSILLGMEMDGIRERDHIVPDMSFLDFTSTLVAKLVKRMIFLNTSIKIKHELVFYQPENPGECLMNIIEHASKRREILDQGTQVMATHIANL